MVLPVQRLFTVLDFAWGPTKATSFTSHPTFVQLECSYSRLKSLAGLIHPQVHPALGDDHGPTRAHGGWHTPESLLLAFLGFPSVIQCHSSLSPIPGIHITITSWTEV